jgi:hypothetical protein
MLSFVDHSMGDGKLRGYHACYVRVIYPFVL